MAKKSQQEFVQHITPRSEDFSQWYTDVVRLADLMDYTPVRGCMAIKPYGYGIWELIQQQLDAEFKRTGHQNVSMPMLIPESLLLKEADHVEGFAPEVAWVTQGGTEPLAERLAVRPTSETIFCTMYAKWVQTLARPAAQIQPVVLRHALGEDDPPVPAHGRVPLAGGSHRPRHRRGGAGGDDADAARLPRFLREEPLAIPVYCGQKSEKEKFAGARATYSVEAMMQDGKALQAARATTSARISPSRSTLSSWTRTARRNMRTRRAGA